jgi:hypothetical protein
MYAGTHCAYSSQVIIASEEERMVISSVEAGKHAKSTIAVPMMIVVLRTLLFWPIASFPATPP